MTIRSATAAARPRATPGGDPGGAVDQHSRGSAKIATVRNVMPRRPIREAVCASGNGSDIA